MRSGYFTTVKRFLSSSEKTHMDNKTRILIVDDEELIVELLQDYFEDKNFDVVTAFSGNTAFQILKNDSSTKMVVSDIRMGDGTGVDLLNQMQGLGKSKPPLVFVSGFSEITEEEAIEKGAVAYLHKPIDRKELLEVVKKNIADHSDYTTEASSIRASS